MEVSSDVVNSACRRLMFLLELVEEIVRNWKWKRKGKASRSKLEECAESGGKRVRSNVERASRVEERSDWVS